LLLCRCRMPLLLLRRSMALDPEGMPHRGIWSGSISRWVLRGGFNRDRPPVTLAHFTPRRRGVSLASWIYHTAVESASWVSHESAPSITQTRSAGAPANHPYPGCLSALYRPSLMRGVILHTRTADLHGHCSNLLRLGAMHLKRRDVP
jgi:hypothetical protein